MIFAECFLRPNVPVDNFLPGQHVPGAKCFCGQNIAGTKCSRDKMSPGADYGLGTIGTCLGPPPAGGAHLTKKKRNPFVNCVRMGAL